MNTINFAPLIRSSVGFEPLEQIFDQMFKSNGEINNFPHYNIIKSNENEYRITLAVAGFSSDNLDITEENNTLIIEGKINSSENNYLYKGISNRKFCRKFQLADFIEVASANMKDGLLHIDLIKKIPEELKPKKISINKTLN
ncbi:Hsp20 family protein [Alphaproteobacteria bacterium]|nr:Hsp20 family protein [Alphaproteobacteria bacterium]